MKRMTRIVMAALVLTATTVAWAQEKMVPQPLGSAFDLTPARPPVPVKVQLVLARYQGDVERRGERPERRLRMGVQVPIPATATDQVSGEVMKIDATLNVLK